MGWPAVSCSHKPPLPLIQSHVWKFLSSLHTDHGRVLGCQRKLKASGQLQPCRRLSGPEPAPSGWGWAGREPGSELPGAARTPGRPQTERQRLLTRPTDRASAGGGRVPRAGRSQWGRGGKQARWEGDRTQQLSEDAEVSPSWAPQSRSFGAADRCRASQTPCDAPRPPAASQPPNPS